MPHWWQVERCDPSDTLLCRVPDCVSALISRGNSQASIAIAQFAGESVRPSDSCLSESDSCLSWQVDVLEGLLISELAAARGVKRSASSSVKCFILDLNYVSVAPEEEIMM